MLSGVGFLEPAHRVRRGERGVEWMGGPLWSPAPPCFIQKNLPLQGLCMDQPEVKT